MDKPKLIEVTDPEEIEALWIARTELGTPILIQESAYAPLYAVADELRAWRAAQAKPGDDHGA